MTRATTLHELLEAASQGIRIGLICVILAVSATGTAWAQGQGTPPPRVGPSFTIPPVQEVSVAPTGSPLMTPDPSGTRYAITSVTVSNAKGGLQGGTAEPVTLTLIAVAFGTPENNTCRLLHLGFVETAPGPTVTVSPQDTVHLAFPQPYITAPVDGPFVCLGATAITSGGNQGLTWSAVGYKILP
jgi:hypothetical protein